MNSPGIGEVARWDGESGRCDALRRSARQKRYRSETSPGGIDALREAVSGGVYPTGPDVVVAAVQAALLSLSSNVAALGAVSAEVAELRHRHAFDGRTSSKAPRIDLTRTHRRVQSLRERGGRCPGAQLSTWAGRSRGAPSRTTLSCMSRCGAVAAGDPSTRHRAASPRKSAAQLRRNL